MYVWGDKGEGIPCRAEFGGVVVYLFDLAGRRSGSGSGIGV